ncbi:hypothetical protein GIB67_011598, partial [Kingdonia uniflora]
MSTYMMIGEETVCLNALYTLYPMQWLEYKVIDVCIKALIKYFYTKHRARPDIKRIMLTDVFACNIWAGLSMFRLVICPLQK